MMINPGSDRPQGPWDPNAKRTFDVSNAVTMLMLLVPVLALVVAVSVWG